MEQEEKKTILGLRASALLEMALFFVAATLIDVLLLDGTRFREVSPHPYWIVVLLMACQYGTAEGLVAAAISTLLLVLGNLPEQGLQQTLYDYWFMVLATPLMWLVAAVALGELRQRHIRERDSLRQSLEDSREREEKITQSYEWTKELKEKLELRVAGQLRSSVSAYQAARAMERLQPAEVLSGLEDLVSAVLSPDQFSVFVLEQSGMTLALSHGWRDGDSFSRQFAPRTDLYRAIVGEQERLCVVNADHERLLAGQGVLASPIVDKATGEVLGMLKLERLGFTELNLSSIETFAAICEWAGAAMANARKYQTAREGSIINPDHNLFTNNYFQRHVEYISALGKRVGFEIHMLVVRIANADALGEETRLSVARSLADGVDRVLRAVDLAFDYQGTSDEYSIVLPATDRRGAEIVQEKIRAQLSSRLAGPAAAAEFSYSIQTLQAK